MVHPPIVIDSDLPIISSDDLLDRRSKLNIYESDDLLLDLNNTPPPTALITAATTTWKDRYLSGLNEGDWVTTIGSGYENFPLDSLSKKGILVTHTPGVSALQIAEHVFGMVFSFTRMLWMLRQQQRNHNWNKPWVGMTDLADDTCCVVGIGSIGEAVAERAKAFGMEVRGVKSNYKDYQGVADTIFPPHSLHQALDGVHLIVLAVPLTETTQNLIGKEELDKASNDAIVVNVARGPVLNTDDLLTALETNSLKAACLDVTNPEPLPHDSPLWDRKDVFITPHCAGRSNKYTSRFLDRYFPQYDRWRNNEEVKNQVV